MNTLSFKLAEPEIDPNNIWADDKLNRKSCANFLTNIILGQNKPLVLSLNGFWGSGKTFFLKRWQKHLERDGVTAIYFNAWEDDYCNDPLVAIIGQLWHKSQ